jgi:hypothetical protein
MAPGKSKQTTEPDTQPPPAKLDDISSIMLEDMWARAYRIIDKVTFDFDARNVRLTQGSDVKTC